MAAPSDIKCIRRRGRDGWFTESAWIILDM